MRRSILPTAALGLLLAAAVIISEIRRPADPRAGPLESAVWVVDDRVTDRSASVSASVSAPASDADEALEKAMGFDSLPNTTPNPLRARVDPSQLKFPSFRTEKNGIDAVSWEGRLDDILDDPDLKHLERIDCLFALLDTLPLEGQVEAVLQLGELISDEEYSRLAPLLLKAEVSAEIHDVLLADLSDRPAAIKLPIFLELARTPDHPLGADALEDVAFYIDAVPGSSWTDLEQQMIVWLAAHPDGY